MKKVETVGTVQDVAEIIKALYENMEILVYGEAYDEVCQSVFRTLTEFKVTYTEKMTEEGQLIKIYD
jgi:ABC-type uncharacterized transport system ATPase subunit